jgi:hypothetical protein
MKTIALGIIVLILLCFQGFLFSIAYDCSFWIGLIIALITTALGLLIGISLIYLSRS